MSPDFRPKRFLLKLKVQPTDIDAFQHVNNEVYLKWCLQSATAHSESVGFSLEHFVDSGFAFVVRRHELDYLAPAVLGEELHLETWADQFEGARTIRHYVLHRAGDQKLLVRGQTQWVYINLRTGKPVPIPAEVLAAFIEPQERSEAR